MKRTARLAIDGGPKAFARAAGRPQPKIGVDEFMSLAERFGFTPDALARLRRTLSDDDLRGHGPNLARYACPFPNDVPPKGVQFELFGQYRSYVEDMASLDNYYARRYGVIIRWRF